MTLNQLQPFNAERFDACLAYLAQSHNRTLTQYDMVKIHVMADIYHTLKYGKPIIGGPLRGWPHGPVVDSAYNRVMHWAHDWDDDHEQQPESFRIVRKTGKSFVFEPTVEVSEDDFSPAELAAMQAAWNCVMTKGWNRSQDFFHKESFVGRVWEKTGGNGEPIDWRDIIDAYAQENPTFEAQPIKALISI